MSVRNETYSEHVMNKYNSMKPTRIIFFPCWNTQLIFLTHRGLLTQVGYVNLGQDNGLFPDNNKPLPKPVLTYRQ